ncbi:MULTISPECIES: hypothetical protein [unclassified Gilliamella]|nr:MULTISPECIES: hypothetical protein [unclassified Gilliamella]
MSKNEYQQYCYRLKVNKAKPSNFPYIPTLEPDWFEQYHEI